MKALIWVIIAVIIGWGVWFFAFRDDSVVNDTDTPVEQVNSGDDIDLGEFQDKG